MNEKQKEDASRLCLACGLCCDGTLIGFVELNQSELPALKKVMDFEEEQGHGFFLQPCKKFCKGCTVYNDRPSQCASFECGLLQSLNNESLYMDDAIGKSEFVKQFRRRIQAQLEELAIRLNSLSFYFQMVELKHELKKDKVGDARYEERAALLREIMSLNSYLETHFTTSLN